MCWPLTRGSGRSPGGSAVDVIVWQKGTARLLDGRTRGRYSSPTGAPASPWLPATLHQFWHSALTKAAENGADTGTMLAYSGHTSVARLARCTRVSPDALAR